MLIKNKFRDNVNSAYITFKGVCTVCLILLFLGSSCQKDENSLYEKLSAEEKRSADYAMMGLETRPGLETTLFAAEDMLVNPTNMDIDAEGRVWVTEGYNYRPDLNPGNPTRPEGDRIVILEDTDFDGQADSSKVFYQGNDINSALGLLVLDRRVIVSRSPHVFVLTDTDGDDRADRKEVLFSGIEGEQHDHGVHAFVFGPDGKLYFNMGNEGKILKDASGRVVRDVFGKEVKAEGHPYHQGMVFRCNLDGSGFEVLAHNFRNNYEVAVDSYGTLWQSDNDDDGNQGVRINYVMEYGNYGYSDERTGAGWRTRRTGMASDIPTRHWHQNDPGVIPNLLQTGAGSPTGILIYEGELLPEIFRNEIIHADAGPNVIRSYPVSPEGAGYRARIEPLLKGTRDQWFRPSDVTVAPDGSIFVSDWYDPGVGGHQMGDQQKGRIFRVAPEGEAYHLPEFNVTSPEGAAEALKSPNMNARAKAWMRLHDWDAEAEPALRELWTSENPRYRARALWLLSKIEGKGKAYIDQALNDEHPDIRITGLRAARQLDLDIMPYAERLVKDPSPRVRREVALALHRNTSPEAAKLWTRLALQYKGNDRWQLEALGIGAAGQWDRFFKTWLDAIGPDWNTPAGRDIVWRSRADRAVPLLVELIKDPEFPLHKKLRYFRAFDFHDAPGKQEAIASILDYNKSDNSRVRVLALNHLSSSFMRASPKVRMALEEALETTEGSYDFIDLVGKYQLTNQNEELVDVMLAFPDSSLGVSAASLALEQEGGEMIAKLLNGNNRESAVTAIKVLGRVEEASSLDLLQEVILDEHKDISIRKEAVRAMASGWFGENRLVEMVKGGVLPPSLKPAAAEVLSGSWRDDVRKITQRFLSGEVRIQQTSLPPMAELVAMHGNIENGQRIFEQSCRICHRVNEEGADFGPGLSEIGAKLPREALYEAVIQPDAGISFGYEGYVLTLADGSTTAGIIRSKTESELVLIRPGGLEKTYKMSEIVSREQMGQSLMPELASTMTRQELADLVEYLHSLK